MTTSLTELLPGAKAWNVDVDEVRAALEILEAAGMRNYPDDFPVFYEIKIDAAGLSRNVGSMQARVVDALRGAGRPLLQDQQVRRALNTIVQAVRCSSMSASSPDAALAALLSWVDVAIPYEDFE